MYARLLRTLRKKGLQQALKLVDMRQHGAAKKHELPALNDYGREVVDFDIACNFRLIFDIDPCERDLRKTRDQRIERWPVFTTTATPFGTQAGDKKCSFGHLAPTIRGRSDQVR